VGYQQQKIYHVHGRVPLISFSDASESKSIVFAENEYMLAEKYTYDWLNAVQAERIHRKDMMIIGFSVQDYNFKRILHNLSPLPPDEQKRLMKEVERVLNKRKEKQPENKNAEFDPDIHIHFIFLLVEDFLRNTRLPQKAPGDVGCVPPTDDQ